MHWKLFATLAETAGEREPPVEAEPGATFGAALDALIERHPDLEGAVLDDDGNLLDHVRALRNGQPIDEADGFDTELTAGDELALFPPVSGG